MIKVKSGLAKATRLYDELAKKAGQISADESFRFTARRLGQCTRPHM
jgi:hypothetical protein